MTSFFQICIPLVTSTPSMELQCKRVWGEDGHFNVSVSVSLPETEPSNHISQFTFSPTLRRNGQSIQTLDQDTLIPQVAIYTVFLVDYFINTIINVFCMTDLHTLSCRETAVNLWRYYQHGLYQRRITCTQWRFRYIIISVSPDSRDFPFRFWMLYRTAAFYCGTSFQFLISGQSRER